LLDAIIDVLPRRQKPRMMVLLGAVIFVLALVLVVMVAAPAKKKSKASSATTRSTATATASSAPATSHRSPSTHPTTSATQGHVDVYSLPTLHDAGVPRDGGNKER